MVEQPRVFSLLRVARPTNNKLSTVSINSSDANLEKQISNVTIPDDVNYITVEVVAEDGDKLYIILSAYYYADATAYTDFDLIVGKLPHNDDELSKKYLAKIYDKHNKKLIALQKADKDCSELEKLVGELKQWQQ